MCIVIVATITAFHQAMNKGCEEKLYETDNNFLMRQYYKRFVVSINSKYAVAIFSVLEIASISK